MSNKLSQDTLHTSQRNENPKAHPMSAEEAARIICDLHTLTLDRAPRGFIVNFTRPPDFTKVDEHIYYEAWRVLRRVGGIKDSDSEPA
jgi:hypothetical protein